MILKNIAEAKAQLSALIEAVSNGEEVVIAKAGVPIAKLVPYRRVSKQRVPGKLRGQIVVQRDFDQLPADIGAAFGFE